MTADQLREFARRQPFAPFTIHMNDGSRLKVSGPDVLFVPTPWKFNAILSLGQDRFTIIYLRNIAHISARGAWPKTSGRKRRNGPPDDDT